LPDVLACGSAGDLRERATGLRLGLGLGLCFGWRDTPSGKIYSRNRQP